MLKQSQCKNTFILVGADKGGVGKTTMCRVLLDYIAPIVGPSIRIFDTEPGGGVLKRFFPAATTIDLTDSVDQESVINNLGAARVTIVDIRAGLLTPTLHLFQRIGFKHGEEAHLAVFHVLGNNIASLDELSNTAALMAQGGDHILVKNSANAGKFFDGDDATLAKYLQPIKRSAMIEIGNLDASAAERVDKANQPFSTFAADTANSRVMRGLVSAWYGDCAATLDTIGFKNLLT